MSLDNLDEVIQKIRYKRTNEFKPEDERVELKKEAQEFDAKFGDVYNMVTDCVDRFNTKLAPENIKLEIIRGVENETSNRKSMQVVLNENKADFNLLENPYLLIEGYSNNGDIRIVQGGSMDQGNTVNVNNLNSEVVKNELSNFLVHSF